jgi:peptide/nickel transport system substrate-binding protein
VQADSGPVAFTLKCTPGVEVLQVCQALVAQWKEAGITATIDSVEQTTLITSAVTGDYQASIWRQFGSPDPDGDSTFWNGANSQPPIALNMTGNQDPVLDAALLVGRSSAKPEERELAYVTVQQRFAADLPYIWLSHAAWVLAAGDDLRGIDGGTLPDGSPSAALISGVARVSGMWFER